MSWLHASASAHAHAHTPPPRTTGERGGAACLCRSAVGPVGLASCRPQPHDGPAEALAVPVRRRPELHGQARTAPAAEVELSQQAERALVRQRADRGLQPLGEGCFAQQRVVQPPLLDETDARHEAERQAGCGGGGGHGGLAGLAPAEADVGARAGRPHAHGPRQQGGRGVRGPGGRRREERRRCEGWQPGLANDVCGAPPLCRLELKGCHDDCEAAARLREHACLCCRDGRAGRGERWPVSTARARGAGVPARAVRRRHGRRRRPLAVRRCMRLPCGRLARTGGGSNRRGRRRPVGRGVVRWRCPWARHRVLGRRRVGGRRAERPCRLELMPVRRERCRGGRRWVGGGGGRGRRAASRGRRDRRRGSVRQASVCGLSLAEGCRPGQLAPDGS
mmetsp:Transcript_18711/g.71147  ORF Transcript_18711/g.71147 Transcript_18711/m.71147 type:complete len:393 (+) Transcript_18711:1797-2975(+)